LAKENRTGKSACATGIGSPIRLTLYGWPVQFNEQFGRGGSNLFRVDGRRVYKNIYLVS
jgi:hypothetical protein